MLSAAQSSVAMAMMADLSSQTKDALPISNQRSRNYVFAPETRPADTSRYSTAEKQALRSKWSQRIVDDQSLEVEDELAQTCEGRMYASDGKPGPAPAGASQDARVQGGRAARSIQHADKTTSPLGTIRYTFPAQQTRLSPKAVPSTQPPATPTPINSPCPPKGPKAERQLPQCDQSKGLPKVACPPEAPKQPKAERRLSQSKRMEGLSQTLLRAKQDLVLQEQKRKTQEEMAHAEKAGEKASRSVCDESLRPSSVLVGDRSIGCWLRHYHGPHCSHKEHEQLACEGELFLVGPSGAERVPFAIAFAKRSIIFRIFSARQAPAEHDVLTMPEAQMQKGFCVLRYPFNKSYQKQTVYLQQPDQTRKFSEIFNGFRKMAQTVHGVLPSPAVAVEAPTDLLDLSDEPEELLPEPLTPGEEYLIDFTADNNYLEVAKGSNMAMLQSFDDEMLRALSPASLPPQKPLLGLAASRWAC